MAVTDILTLAEAKDVLRVAALDTSDDARISSLVEQATAILDDVTAVGPVVRRAVTEEVSGCNRSGNPIRTLRSGLYPVHSWTSVTEYVDGVGTVLTRRTMTTIPTDGYCAFPARSATGLFSGAITRTEYDLDAFWGGPVALSYVAGRFETTADVPPRFKEACGIVVANLWAAVEPGVETMGEYDTPKTSFPRFAIPRAVSESLWSEWQGDHGQA